MPFLGETSALLTAACWSISAVSYTISGRKIGSQVVNRLRVLVAILMLLAINQVLYGQALPLSAGRERWGWLLLSGFVGLAVGDAFLFKAYQLIGARMGLLLLSLAPVFSALIAWAFLGETLTVLQFLGMVLTLGGISWVVFAQDRSGEEAGSKRQVGLGVVCGVVAAVGQAGGLVLSRQGMTGDFPPFAGSLIRMIAAFFSLWALALLQRRARPTLQAAVDNPRSTAWVLFGSVFGPVIGVSLSLLAIQHAKLGVASTLMALPPVIMLPVSYFGFKERFGWQVIAGTLVSIAGVAVLFLPQ